VSKLLRRVTFRRVTCRFGVALIAVVAGLQIGLSGATAFPDHTSWGPSCGGYPNTFGQYTVLMTAPTRVEDSGGGGFVINGDGTGSGVDDWEYVYWLPAIQWQQDGQNYLAWGEEWMTKLAGGGGGSPWLHWNGEAWVFAGRWGTDTSGWNVGGGYYYTFGSLLWWSTQPYEYGAGLLWEDLGSCNYLGFARTKSTAPPSSLLSSSTAPQVTETPTRPRRPANPHGQPRDLLSPGSLRCTIKGNRKSNRLRGTRRFDVICGRGGNDRIVTSGGGDVVLAGGGKDRIRLQRSGYAFGQGGADKFFARNGNKNYLEGGGGRDWAQFDRNLDSGKGRFWLF
jgi:hypothetical protein